MHLLILIVISRIDLESICSYTDSSAFEATNNIIVGSSDVQSKTVVSPDVWQQSHDEDFTVCSDEVVWRVVRLLFQYRTSVPKCLTNARIEARPP